MLIPGKNLLIVLTSNRIAKYKLVKIGPKVDFVGVASFQVEVSVVTSGGYLVSLNRAMSDPPCPSAIHAWK